MKKSELVVGKEYYVQPSTASWTTANWDVKRVRVVNTDFGKWRWDRVTAKYVKTSYSTGRTGIVVERLHPETGLVTGTEVVTLTSIRGEWEPIKKQVADRCAGVNAAMAARMQKRELAKQATGKAVALVQQLGMPGIKADIYGTKIEIDPDVLVAMLSALDAQGWVYPA